MKKILSGRYIRDPYVPFSGQVKIHKPGLELFEPSILLKQSVMLIDPILFRHIKGVITSVGGTSTHFVIQLCSERNIPVVIVNNIKSLIRKNHLYVEVSKFDNATIFEQDVQVKKKSKSVKIDLKDGWDRIEDLFKET